MDKKSAVVDWIQRKHERNIDPIHAERERRRAQLGQLGAVDSKRASSSTALPQSSLPATEARIGRVVLARTNKLQRAGRQVYFPLEDCMIEHFESSSKRWYVKHYQHNYYTQNTTHHLPIELTII